MKMVGMQFSAARSMQFSIGVDTQGDMIRTAEGLLRAS
jgi:hypothetical protein